MKIRFYAFLSALMLALGVGFAGATPAYAGDGENSRIVNYTAYTITGGYVYNAGSGLFYYRSVNIPRNTAFGEPGRYEPRNLHVRNGWCMVYHFHVYGSGTGSNTTVCSPRSTSSGISTFGIYFGDGYNGADYDAVVTSYYAY